MHVIRMEAEGFRERFLQLPDSVKRFFSEEMQPERISPRPPDAETVTRRWVYQESNLPWLKVPIDIPTTAISNEAQNVLDRFVDHRGKDSRGWKSLCLRGLSSHQTLGPKPYGFASEREVPYRWTEVAERCPLTTEFFRERFPCRTLFRIRFMLLEPGGYIEPHCDRDRHGLSGLNIALNQPDGCLFKMRHAGIIPVFPGDALLLDIANQHSVINLSDEARIHLIVHFADPTDQWDQLVCDAFHRHISQPMRVA